MKLDEEIFGDKAIRGTAPCVDNREHVEQIVTRKEKKEERSAIRSSRRKSKLRRVVIYLVTAGIEVPHEVVLHVVVEEVLRQRGFSWDRAV